MKFIDWLQKRDEKLFENMWGNISARGRKPSDGPTGKQSLSSNHGATPAAAAPMQGKMKKK